MTRRSHLAAWLLLWLVSLFVWPLWCGPERLVERAGHDLATLHEVFGPRIATSLARWADVSQRGFGHAGLGDLLSAGAPPVAPSRSALADRVTGQADRHLAAIRVQVHGAALRAVTLLAWWVLLSPLVLAAALDGFAERAIKADTFGSQSPAAFSLAGHALIAGAMLPVLALVAPVSPPAWLTPAWLLAVLLPLRITLAHMQPVFTR